LGLALWPHQGRLGRQFNAGRGKAIREAMATSSLIQFFESIVAEGFWHNRLMLRDRLVFDGRIFDATE
jgi:hypothetical protein